MSNQLRLVLERYLSVQPKANNLSLPLDRNLGDITRYKYVFANALPLRMDRLSSDQPSANVLTLSMSQPLSTIAPPLYFISNSLPLPLSLEVSEQPLSSELPLGMTRRLGTVVGVPVTPPDVSDDVTIAITAIADITPTASATLTVDESENDVNVSIVAYGGLNPTASATVGYDSNVERSSFFEIGIKFEQSKTTGISRQSGFDVTAIISDSVTSKAERSKLVGDALQSGFDSNDQLHINIKSNTKQSILIGFGLAQGFESQKLIGKSKAIDTEQAALVGQSKWYSFESMARRQISRAIRTETTKLIANSNRIGFESSAILSLQKEVLTEFARLPFSKLRYVPPNLSQTVILKEQIIEGWECGSGALRHYVYNDELALPMTRRIADRGASSSLAMPMTMPRGALLLSAADADAMDTYLCKRKTLAVNPTLDVVMCKPKVFGQSSGMAVNANTTFDAIAWLELLIGEKGEAYNKGVIFVTNSVSLTRSDDGREIKLLGFSVGIDSNSYAWSFSATVPLSELSKVDTAHEQQIGVDFEFNGEYARFILDGCDDSASFGESSLTIKGKSRAMLLAHPYATHRGFKYDTPMSARQIADDELNRSGVPSGFTLDWQLAGVNGWDVPANTYSYTGRTPINSLQWIAEAAGGFINAHMSEDIIHVLANYPIPSWEWAAQEPSISLPMSLITSRSRGRINKPSYNGVTVYGERDGSIGALIKRTGTSGGYQPPMVTSDLITEQAAAISRGISILSDTGDIGNIGISMPLHQDIGVLKPSTLIEVNDGDSWVGMVRGTTITGRLSSDRALEIDQSIDVERHFDKEATSG
ncbi:hypothetical protein ACTXKB_03575 [Psychrobacter aquimaris]|uniref:hypothetical protein n=1 Tax=Psychrobacter aquimaris TaxID=292733 RepID=UPI003FD128D9